MKFTRALAATNRHIATHATLEFAFQEAVKQEPKVIVEIGTGVRGLRTQVICRVARLFDADMVSVDVKDCRDCGNGRYPRWRFVQQDGVMFAEKFKEYAERSGISQGIDLLFIDTNERYMTTRSVWEGWRGFLSPSCSVMFRCSNLSPVLQYADGRATNLGWENYRGVYRVVQEIIGPFDETKPFIGRRGEWQVKHIPWGAGLTVLRREG